VQSWTQLTDSASASLDTALGVALVPYYAPKHHARATRLLSGAITFDANNNQARFARAQIHQHAGEWAKARETFQQVLDLVPDDKLEMASTEEIGWCLVNEDKLEEGRDVLEDVAQRRTNKWVERGEKEGDDAAGRARVWYRLGRTEWMIYSELFRHIP
jgi:superkiller protein 3